jgi:ribosomal-protein-alanine N-acetyltransferase
MLAIERACFEHPRGEDDFNRCLRQKFCIGRVAESDGQILGFMVYELHQHYIRLLSVAVMPSVQCCGIGSQLIEHVELAIQRGNRGRIMAEVPETNLAGQLFLKANGFRGVRVLRGFWELPTGAAEDAYLMVKRLAPAKPGHKK